MIRAISHGRAEFLPVPDSEGIEQRADVDLRLVITSESQDEFVAALNAVLDRFAI